MKLEPGKFYETIYGVKVYCVGQLPGGKFVCGPLKDTGEIATYHYHENGLAIAYAGVNIVREWKEPEKREKVYYLKRDTGGVYISDNPHDPLGTQVVGTALLQLTEGIFHSEEAKAKYAPKKASEAQPS